ncbi:site-specific integrase [Candidatus Acetothermia bacterium]|nr:site-specific integrase [Candidatus Acetothermia bacterium]
MVLPDIHNYDRRYESQKRRLTESDVSQRNKQLILEFDRQAVMEQLSLPRRIKLMNSLYNLATVYLKKDFDQATKEDIKQVMLEIESRQDYSPWTKVSYRAVLKKFYKWLVFGDEYRDKLEYPPIVSWIRTNMKKKDQPKVQASDILTEEEVARLIRASEHPRDKAFIAITYELGARIGEVGKLQVKSITKDKYSYLVDVNGKTGQRTPRIVFSAPYITAWLNEHPHKDDLEAPLWVLAGRREKVRARYGSLRAMVLRLAKAAKIQKRMYPHLFRHTRVTHVLINRLMSEAQAKVYFGWAPSSRMLADYQHLVSRDVNDTILVMYGIRKDEETEKVLQPKQCSMCQTINSSDAMFCQKCAQVLDLKAAIALDEKRKQYDERIASFLKDKDAQVFFAKKARELGLWEKLKQTA